jgi:hypothetical protein
MKVWLALLAALSCFSISTLAETWPLSSTVYNSLNNAQNNQFVYVPTGERFTGVKLQGQITAGGSDNVLSVYLDGHLQRVLRPSNGENFLISLPDLPPGFHRIKLVGHSTVLTSTNPKNVDCPPVYSLPLGISDLALQYTPSRVAAPQIAYLPDGLYNRSHPARQPLLGAMDLQPATPSAFGAALRLSSWFKASRGIRWKGGLHANADFQIVLVHKGSLESPARITIQEPAGGTIIDVATQPSIPTLTITYRNDDGLQAAVMALLNGEYRHELLDSSADIPSAVTPPVWGTLVTPTTLSQLGLSNITLRGSEHQSVLLPFPPYWQPIGAPTGHIILRTQAGLADGSHLNVWLGDALAGSDTLAFVGSGNIQRSLPVNGASIPRHTDLGLRLHGILLANRVCDVPVPGVLWISASDSEITLPHRYKAGVMALLPQLIANPSIVASDSSSTLTAALNIAAAEQMVTGGKPLPYVVSFTKPVGGPPALSLLVSQKVFSRLAAAYATKLNQAFLAQSVLLHVRKSGMVQLIASHDNILAGISDVWSKALTQIPDGTLDAALNVDSGTVQILARSPTTALSPQGTLSNRQYKLIVLAVIGFFLLAVSGLLLWLRRWRRS